MQDVDVDEAALGPKACRDGRELAHGVVTRSHANGRLDQVAPPPAAARVRGFGGDVEPCRGPRLVSTHSIGPQMPCPATRAVAPRA